MVVRPIEWGAERVTVPIALGDKEHRVRFAASEEICQEPDFLLPTALLPAMKADASLRLPGEVSPRLASTLPRIQNIFFMWDEERFRRVPVSVGTRGTGKDNRASGVGCFFSGGVDSFYTLLKHQERISHLIFMELPFANQAVQEQATQAARAVAQELGKSLIEVETNLRPFSKDLKVPWNYYHGMRLAGVGLLFQHLFHKILIPGSFDYANLFPWGSHPLLDPLWSTELTEFEHDGVDLTRPEKVALISEYEIAMPWLRVCYKDPDAYNCGRCEKCLRTMIELQMVGALKRCKTFPDDLDFTAIASMDFSDPIRRLFAQQNLKALQRLGTEPELMRTLAGALDKSPETPGEERLKERLSLAHKKLERTRTRQEASEKTVRRLKSRNARLARRNSLLTARYSGWQFRLTEALSRAFLRIPGTAKLRRKLFPPTDRTAQDPSHDRDDR